jgi:hypothetical protein
LQLIGMKEIRIDKANKYTLNTDQNRNSDRLTMTLLLFLLYLFIGFFIQLI